MNLDVATILGALYCASEVGLTIFKRAGGADSRLADRGSLLLLWGTIVASVTVAYSLSVSVTIATLGAAIEPAKYTGIILYAAGLAFRWYSIIYLGRFFTVNVAIAADHQLIDGGPYRFVRHPSYAGALLAFLGLGLTLGNWASLVTITVPVFVVFLRRMRVEEAALLQGLGSQYRDYMTRTKRLIPGVY
jgi:protein-S-isoprenylcysteine O-methyltransferase